MELNINVQERGVSWNEINKNECELASLYDICSWAEMDQFIFKYVDNNYRLPNMILAT